MICKECGNDAGIDKNGHERKFCGSSCSAKYSNKTNPKRKLTKKCKRCNILIRSSYTFCSPDCMNNYKLEIKSKKKIETHKKCSQCKEVLPLASFNFYGDKYHTKCKECFKKYLLDKNENNKRILVEENGGKCTRCGYDKHFRVLQFHHVDPKEKDFALSARSYVKLETLREEAKKCVLLCPNCHIEKHLGLW